MLSILTPFYLHRDPTTNYHSSSSSTISSGARRKRRTSASASRAKSSPRAHVPTAARPARAAASTLAYSAQTQVTCPARVWKRTSTARTRSRQTSSTTLRCKNIVWLSYVLQQRRLPPHASPARVRVPDTVQAHAMCHQFPRLLAAQPMAVQCPASIGASAARRCVRMPMPMPGRRATR